MKFTKIAAGLVMAGLATVSFAQARPDNLSTLKQFKVATTDLNIPTVPQEGKKCRRDPGKPEASQTSARLQDRFVCSRTRCAPYGGRPLDQYAVRRHPQNNRLGGHGSQ